MVAAIPPLLGAKISGIQQPGGQKAGQDFSTLVLGGGALIFASQAGNIHRCGRLFVALERSLYRVDDVFAGLLFGRRVIDFGTLDIELRRSLGWWHSPASRGPIFTIELDNGCAIFAAADKYCSAAGDLWWVIREDGGLHRLFSISDMRPYPPLGVGRRPGGLNATRAT